MLRYQKNKQTISDEEQQKLALSKVCIVGLGGLGGYVLEMLVRLGVGNIRAIDGDCFDETNLNCQLLCDAQNLGVAKSEVAAIRAKKINSQVNIDAVSARVTKDNAESLLSGYDIIVDACDSVETRLLLQDVAEKVGVPLVYGAIAGWFAQISIIFPGDKTMDKIYKTGECKNSMGNPSFTPAAAASAQVSQTIKYLLNKGQLLRNKLLLIDLFDDECELIDL